MSAIQVYPINDAVRLNVLEDKRFKTVHVSVDMLVPLCEETAAVYGVLTRIVTRATREYPDYTKLSQKLAELYGATLDCSITKLGGCQVLSLFAQGIAGRYAFDGEDMVKELSALLFSILSEPLRTPDGNLPEDGFLQEKRQVLEVFDSEFNDKIHYAHKRAEEILFEGKPEGLNRYGTRAQVEALTLPQVSGAWEKLLRSAKFEVFVMGDCHPDPELFRKAFASFGTPLTYAPQNLATAELKDVKEEMPLAQSKLVMGFSADAQYGKSDDFKLMSAVFGGTPSSKLFANVREKMSLCYYCSSSFDANTHTMFVQSGVETENIEKAREVILAQLEEIKAGRITEEEIDSAKLAVGNAYRSVNDSLTAVENWYLSQCFRPEVRSPEEAAASIAAVSKEEIVAAANRVSLNTVYTLKGNA